VERLLESITPLGKGDEWSEKDERIRIVMACRSEQRAEAAISSIRKRFPHRNLLLDFEQLDLSSMQMIEDFCKRLLNR